MAKPWSHRPRLRLTVGGWVHCWNNRWFFGLIVCAAVQRWRMRHGLSRHIATSPHVHTATHTHTPPPHNHHHHHTCQVKPHAEESLLSHVVQKLLVVPTHSQLCVFSRKLTWKWMRLQFMAGYNWARNRPTLDYRCEHLCLRVCKHVWVCVTCAFVRVQHSHSQHSVHNRLCMTL